MKIYLPQPSALKSGSQTIRVLLVVHEVFPGCTRGIYLGLLEIKQNNSK